MGAGTASTGRTNGVAAGRVTGTRHPGPGGRPPVSRIKVGVVTVVVLVVVAAVTAAALALRPGHPAVRHSSHGASARPSASASVTVLTPRRARGFDETSANAGFAIDGKPDTAWQTQFYLNNPVFGGLKTGSGLILDMGKQVRLSSVAIEFGPTPGRTSRSRWATTAAGPSRRSARSRPWRRRATWPEDCTRSGQLRRNRAIRAHLVHPPAAGGGRAEAANTRPRSSTST